MIIYIKIIKKKKDAIPLTRNSRLTSYNFAAAFPAMKRKETNHYWSGYPFLKIWLCREPSLDFPKPEYYPCSKMPVEGHPFGDSSQDQIWEFWPCLLSRQGIWRISLFHTPKLVLLVSPPHLRCPWCGVDDIRPFSAFLCLLRGQLCWL